MVATNKMSELFQGSAYDAATERNYAGAPTFVRGDEERLIQVLTTGVFENTFYVDAKTQLDEALTLFRAFTEKDPDFLARAILYARQEGMMRLVPITALVVLSTGSAIHTKSLFRMIFSQIIQTPGDLADFVTTCRGRKIRGM